MTDEIKKKINDYLSSKWDDDNFPEENSHRLLDEMEEVISKEGWKNIYPIMKNYLVNQCKTPDEIINWYNLFWDCAGYKKLPVPEPYKLVAYLYYKVDVNKYVNAFTILDSIAMSILPVDMIKEPCYAANADSKILKIIDDYKSGKDTF